MRVPEVRSGRLRAGEVLVASTVVQATPDEVYAIVADPRRIPEWSPETVRVTWEAEARFQSWNRRRLGVWRTPARITVAEPGVEFTFVVETMGKDWTEWSYLVEPGPDAGTTLLSERFRMCMDLPFPALVFEWLFLFVRDRRGDLQANLQHCVERIAVIARDSS